MNFQSYFKLFLENNNYDSQIQELTNLIQTSREQINTGMGMGDMRVDFHLGTLFARTLTPWLSILKQDTPTSTRFDRNPRVAKIVNSKYKRTEATKRNASLMLPEFLDRLADIVASLPDRRVRDSKSGKVVNPFSSLMKAFPNGNSSDVVASVIRAAELSRKVFFKTQTRFIGNKKVFGSGVIRDFTNILEILQQIDDETPNIEKGIRLLTSWEGHEKTNAEALEDFELENQGDVMLGDKSSEDFLGGTMYKGKD